jgi:hypothetical protein
MCLVAPEHDAKAQFTDLFTTEIFCVRGGTDSDVLSASLCKVWTASDVLAFVDQQVDKLTADRGAGGVLQSRAPHPVTHFFSGFGASSAVGGSFPTMPYSVEIVGTVTSLLLLAPMPKPTLPTFDALPPPPLEQQQKRQKREEAGSAFPLLLVTVADSQGQSVQAFVTPDAVLCREIRLALDRAVDTDTDRGSSSSHQSEKQRRQERLNRALNLGNDGPAIILRNPIIVFEESPCNRSAPARIVLRCEGGSARLVVADVSSNSGSVDDSNGKENPPQSFLQNSQGEASGRDGDLLPTAGAPSSVPSSSRKRARDCGSFSDVVLSPSSHAERQLARSLFRYCASPAVAYMSLSAALHCVSGQKAAAAADPAVSAEPQTSITEFVWNNPCSSVRHALLSPQAVSCGGSFLLDIVGVVVSKEVNLRGNQTESQISLVLRDVHCADTIIAHFPAAICSGMMLGCVVSIKQCKFLLSNGIRPYIVIHNSSVIGLLGHASDIDTMRFCAHSQRGTTGAAVAVADQGRISRGLNAASAGDPDDDAAPPRSTVARLIDTQQHNRCLWSIAARVVHIKIVEVVLKCKQCWVSNVVKTVSSPSAPRYDVLRYHSIVVAGRVCPWHCSKCCLGEHLAPFWSAQLVVDDGTSECVVRVDGADLILQLITPSLRNNSSFTTADSAFKAYFEEACWFDGEVVFNHQNFRDKSYLLNKSKRQKEHEAKAGAASDGTEPEWPTFDRMDAHEVEKLARLSRRKESAAEQYMQRFIEAADYSSQVDMTVRVIFKKDGLNDMYKTFQKKLDVQRADKDRLHANYLDKKVTMQLNNLELQVVRARRISSSSRAVRAEAWRQLSAYSLLGKDASTATAAVATAATAATATSHTTAGKERVAI